MLIVLQGTLFLVGASCVVVVSRVSVRLCGPKVRKARGNAAGSFDGGDVFIYRDSSIAPLLDLRRWLRVVMDVLGGMLLGGITLCRSLELTAQCDCSLGAGPVDPVSLLMICCGSSLVVSVGSTGWLRMCIAGSSILSTRWQSIGGMRLSVARVFGYGRIP